MELSSGAVGVRDLNGLRSAVAQPHMTFDGKDLYPGTAEKAAALGFSVIKNHPFLDGNKRVGHAAMETFLLLNGFEIDASVEDQEKVILGVASGAVERRELVDWLHNHIIEAHHD